MWKRIFAKWQNYHWLLWEWIESSLESKIMVWDSFHECKTNARAWVTFIWRSVKKTTSSRKIPQWFQIIKRVFFLLFSSSFKHDTIHVNLNVASKLPPIQFRIIEIETGFYFFLNIKLIFFSLLDNVCYFRCA